jgi:hypothetical protein
MVVPLPSDDEVLLDPPDASEANATARAIAAVAGPDGKPTDLQRVLLRAVCAAMTGHQVDLDDLEPTSPQELAQLLARRDLVFRTRSVQLTLLVALVLRPLPPAVVDRIADVADELGVDEKMIPVAHELSTGALGLAAKDFDRNGYTAHWHPEDTQALHTSVELHDPWDVDAADPELAARWEGLGDLPPGTLGRGVWEMYRARGFEFPGRPGSAPPLLAQHDWVHVLADYGTSVESEMEVFAFIARANDDMRAFSLLAMVVSLFETGYLRSGAGLFEADPGHLSAGEHMAVRVADAMRRGALCYDDSCDSDSIDFLQIDWFELAPLSLDQVRRLFCIPPKSEEAIASGSVGPWEPGGISEFQLRAGRAMAERQGRPYDPHGAAVA